MNEMGTLTYSMSMQLEDRVHDLESQLAQSNQLLRSREHVLGMQQERFKKMEGKYKQCLNDMAFITCEHQRTRGDLENVRIILKSFENRSSSMVDAECQIDSAAPTEKTVKVAVRDNEELNVLFRGQTEKIDRIIDMLLNISLCSNSALEASVEELQKISQNLCHVSQQHIQERLILTRVLAIGASEERAAIDFTTCEEEPRVFAEFGSQTRHDVRDYAVNIPEARATATIQAVVGTVDRGATTETIRMHKTIECKLTLCANMHVQCTSLEDICTVKDTIRRLEAEMSCNEKVYENFENSLTQCNRLLEYFERCDTEVGTLRVEVATLNGMIQRDSVLSIEQIKDLCKECTLQAGAHYAQTQQEHRELTAEIEMLKAENKELRMSHTEVPRMLIELENQHSQTMATYETSECCNQHRSKIADLSVELQEAYEAIKFLERKLEQHEENAIALQDIKNLCVSMNTEATELRNYHMHEMRANYENEIECLQGALQEMQSLQHERDIHAVETQCGDCSPVDVLQVENKQLLRIVNELQSDIKEHESDDQVVQELRTMCLKLGQNADECNRLQDENALLNKRLKDANSELVNLQQTYAEAISKTRDEVGNLRMEHKDLSEGIRELAMVVQLNVQMKQYYAIATSRESDGTPSAVEMTSNESASALEATTSEEIKLSASSSDVQELKVLCRDLTKRLKEKQTGSGCQISGTLGSLENDLKVLMAEFIEFKWSAQNENKLLKRQHGELTTQNEELVSCLHEYKNVNETLLAAHFELEKAKNILAAKHQRLLEERNIATIECGINTIIHAHDIADVEQLKFENSEAQQQNLQLRQDIGALLAQINAETQKRSCEQCGRHQKTLQSLKNELQIGSTENASLRTTLAEREYQLSDMQKLCKTLTTDVEDNSNLREEIERCEAERAKLRTQLAHADAQVRSMQLEKEAIDYELNALNAQNNCMREELKEARAKLQICEYELAKQLKSAQAVDERLVNDKHALLKAEAEMLRAQLGQKDMMVKCNETMLQEYAKIEEQLRTVTEMKHNVELDFENYVRTNSLLHETVAQQNTALVGELRQAQADNDLLVAQLRDLKRGQEDAKANHRQTVNECMRYQTQLQDMTGRIEAHMQEHKAYKAEVDVVKRTLQAEIANLRALLEVQQSNYLDKVDAMSLEGKALDKSIAELKQFIAAKEHEIDFLVEQKLKALEMIGKLSAAMQQQQEQQGGRKETKEIKTVKQPMRPSAASRMRTQPRNNAPCRSASVPRTSNQMHVVWEREVDHHLPPVTMTVHRATEQSSTSRVPLRKPHITSKKK